MRKFKKNLILMKIFIAVAAVSVLLRVGFVIASGMMTNADVVNLVNAEMSPAIILSAIRGADETAFDISSNALVALKKAGVPDVVIQEMIGSLSTDKPKTAAASDALNPEHVIAIDDGVKITMRYLIPSIRTATRAMGWGGVAQYAVIRGLTATLRLSSQPSFVVVIPSNAQAAAYVTLIRLAQRKKHNIREILTGGGGGFGGWSGGYPQDRVITMTANLATNQSKAPEGFMVYELTSSKPLKKGEYVVTVSSVQVQGVFLNAAGADPFFDFGVD